MAAQLTTPIQLMDPASMTLPTRSGRVYDLLAPPNVDPDFLAEVHLSLTLSGLQKVTDVSLQTYADMKRKAH